jgi:hypothetical protein
MANRLRRRSMETVDNMTTMTKSEFAKHINVKPGYVTQLITAGRLVMEGNKVIVEESMKLIEETRDPSKTAVSARHEKSREEKLKQPQPEQEQETRQPEEITAGAGSAYQHAKAFREKYNALSAKMAYEREMKTLLPADDVRQAVMDGDTIIRSRLESLPDQLAPQLAAETDEQRVRAILIEQIEHLLDDLSSSFYKLIRI